MRAGSVACRDLSRPLRRLLRSAWTSARNSAAHPLSQKSLGCLAPAKAFTDRRRCLGANGHSRLTAHGLDRVFRRSAARHLRPHGLSTSLGKMPLCRVVGENYANHTLEITSSAYDIGVSWSTDFSG